MPVEADTSAEAGCFLSVRSSCDRCRVQKLKCSVPPGSGACERCTRAKLPCVFGRRTRPKRASSNDEAQARPPATRNTSPVAQAVPLTPFASATPVAITTSSPSTTALATATPVKILQPPSTMAAVTQGDYLPTQGPYMELAGPVDSAGHDTEPGCHYIRSWDNLVLLQDSFTDVLESDSDLGNHGWTQFGFDVADVTMFDSGQVDLPRWPSQLGSLTAASRPMDIPSAAANTKADGHRMSNTAVLTSQQLITLISDIQQRLRKLEESPWHAGSARSLDDYPVGSVLQLSHQFSSIAGLALSTSRAAGGEGLPAMNDDNRRAMTIEASSEDGTATKDEGQDERKANGTVLDTPTILLLLSGYMWLVRIFDIVLGHFQKHLNRMPSRYEHCGPNRSNTAAATGRTLRLGELHWANGALDLQKIHIAVSMLLDALHEVEGHMGHGGGVVRDLAMALLLNNPTRRGDDGWRGGGLGERVTAVKELLREKMGL